jgi:hypothetical protein
MRTAHLPAGRISAHEIEGRTRRAARENRDWQSGSLESAKEVE